MVGHSGVLKAGIKAVKTVDYCVHELTNQFLAKGGAVIITADHGNVEEMINLANNTVDKNTL
jgi:2,3-bisphosphoglycerate-independent phosphoglycerate mutase